MEKTFYQKANRWVEKVFCSPVVGSNTSVETKAEDNFDKGYQMGMGAIYAIVRISVYILIGLGIIGILIFGCLKIFG